MDDTRLTSSPTAWKLPQSMKFSAKFNSASSLLRPVHQPVQPCGASRQILLSLMPGCLIALGAILVNMPTGAIAAPEASITVAQAVTTSLPPVPYATGGASAPGEQYVVIINGNSDLLLQQIRQVEPGAFINAIDGSPIIQAGRFNSVQNAQVRVDELALLGVGAQVQPTSFVSAPIAVTPPANYPSSIPTNATASVAGNLPPLPGTAAIPTASTVEFGQTAAPIPTIPPPPASAYPTSVTPPTVNALPAASPASASGYYVVLPGSASDLNGLANQIINLGAPSSLVQARTAPRGPHVAVGPYGDRGIAQEWSSYLQGAGLGQARVHFE